MTARDSRVQLVWFSKGVAAAAAAVGFIILLRWYLDNTLAASALAGGSTLKPNTALCLLLLGAALALQNPRRASALRWRSGLAFALAAIVELIAFTNLAESFGHFHARIDTWIAPRTLAASSDWLHLSASTAIVFVLMAASLLFLGFRSKPAGRLSNLFASIAGGCGVLVTFGHLYEAGSSYEFSLHANIALLTALLFCLLSIAVVAARPYEGFFLVLTSERPGGVLARRFLPAILILPFVIGLLRMESERFNLPHGLGPAALASIIFAVLLTALWLSARALNRLDRQRTAATAAAQGTEERFATVIENLTEGLVVWDLNGQMLHWNRAAVAMHGFSSLSECLRKLPELVADFQLFTLEGRELPLEEWPQARLQSGEFFQDFCVIVRKRGTDWERVFSYGGAKASARDGSPLLFLTIDDITARRQSEVSLAASEDRLRRILNALPAATYKCNAEGLIIDFNPAATELFGRALHLSDPRDRFCGSLKIFQPDGTSLAPEQSWMAVAVREQRAVQGREVVIEREDGTRRTVLAYANPLWEPSGRFTGAVSVLVDVTEQKAVEHDLRDSEERFRQLAENIPQVFWMTDTRDSRTLYISPEYETVWGRSRESFRTNPGSWLESVHPDDRERTAASVARAFQGNYNDMYRIVRPDGQVRWIRARTFPIRNAAGEIYRIGGIATDITETRKTTSRLELQHTVTSAVAESSSVAQAARRVLEAVAKRFDWKLGELWSIEVVNQRSTCTEIWHAPSPALAAFADTSRLFSFGPGEGLPGRVWQSGEPGWVTELKNDPDFFHAELAANAGLHAAIGFPIKAGTKVLAIVQFFTDQLVEPDSELLSIFEVIGLQLGQFIERKHIEEQFRQSQKMESVGQLAGGIAHDFNNMLAIIQGRVSLLNLHQGLPTEVEESVKEISVATERAASLTRQLLAFGRRQVMQPRDLALNETISDMLKLLRRVLGEDITIKFERSAVETSIHADPGMLDQVLLNLAVNAREAMPRGGQLTLRASEEKVDGEIARANSDATTETFACITVTDTGTGIPGDVLPRIFEPFFTTKAVGKGLGLGLSTVYGIVKQQHGWITVKSEPGHGSTFKVFLPALARRRVVAKSRPVAAPIVGKGETILLVEDEVSLRLITQIILERHGYNVIVAESGREALAAWEKDPAKIDLIMTDIVMPDGMTGHDLGTHIQAVKPNVKLIYMSGYNAAAVGHGFVLHEGINFLQKPIDLDKMLAAIRDSLDQK